MSKEFRMRSKNNHVILGINQQLAEDIDLEPVKLKEFSGKFLYYPTNISGNTLLPEINKKIPAKEPVNKIMFKKPEYEDEMIIYDTDENKWKLVKKI